MRKVVCLSLLMVLSVPLWANDATIYRCKTPDGGYVYQQSTCSDDQVGNDTAAKRLWRKMRSYSQEGINILNDLGADTDSIKTCQKRMDVFSKKVASLEKQVNSFALDHKQLVKAYGYLKDCTECRTSAASSCQLSNTFLDKAMAEIMEY
jgi:hypothetical protein